MARQRKNQRQTSENTTRKAEDTLTEEEQWRIIDQTGVLKNIPRTTVTEDAKTIDDDPFSPLCLEVFNTLLLLVPFSSLYIMMDILAHRQYAQRYDAWQLAESVLWGIPLLSVFVFYTTRHKRDKRVQALLVFLSVTCGSRLIYVVNWSNWKTVVRQCPPLGTVWVYTILQLDLLYAVLALAIVAAFTKWKDLKIIF